MDNGIEPQTMSVYYAASRTLSKTNESDVYVIAWRVAFIKRTIDLSVSVLLLILLSPGLFVVAASLAYSRGPILFSQARVGRNGRTFPCYKFRTMVPQAEALLAEILANDPVARAEWDRDRKLRNDPRITFVGRFLRKTSLDELPQLLNVLRGDMSLIGPRPVVPSELALYGRCSRRYMAVRPGITGLWQVSGRNDTDYRRRIALDTYYVRRQSIMLDFQIALKTVRVVLMGSGAY